MLTIFTVPKPFKGHDGVIQRNAIRSWIQLRPECEIILLGNDTGTAETAAELGLRHIPGIDCNEYGTPLVNSIFAEAQRAASNSVICYINADIILLNDFLPSVTHIKWNPFLMIGQRWDIEIKELINFDENEWERQLKQHLTAHGRLHAPSGIDYFIIPKETEAYQDIPPFALGRTTWDNWFVYRARSMKVPVIDATGMITAIHQNHGYAHVKEGKTGAFRGPEARHNQELIGNMECSLGIKNADWILTPKGLKRAWTPGHLYYRLYTVPTLHPNLRFLNIPKKMIFGISGGIRSLIGKPTG